MHKGLLHMGKYGSFYPKNFFLQSDSLNLFVANSMSILSCSSNEINEIQFQLQS